MSNDKSRKIDAAAVTGEEAKNTRDEHGRFLPGYTANPAGKPKGYRDPLKEIGRRIAEQRISQGLTIKQRKALEKAGFQLEDVTMIDTIMMDLATSRNPTKQNMFIERTYGKVPNVNINHNDSFDFMKYRKKYTDSELEQIAEGADALEILLNKIPDIDEEE